ncbi:hypothetical protein GCM10020369_73730 [Cryptosporangium minutisporangium]|uniref:NADH-quinone oxidoreductase subunit K n=1 Tax=Cryptosporangium minutisporangium TaxID=113569 RepID=A0ABP6T9Y2_9ACTN
MPYVLAAVLFGIGLYGVLVRRNLLLLLMAVELLLNAVNLILVTADVSTVGVPRSGAVFALFVIVLAAAEVGVGLALILQLYRLRQTVAVDRVDIGDGAGRADVEAGADGVDADQSVEGRR